MLEKESEAWLRRLFVDQFEPDGDGYIYRYNMKGAPIRVTRAERDRYVAIFDRFSKWNLWILTAAILLFGGLYLIYVIHTDRNVSNVAVITGTGILLIASVSASFWIRNLPMRELRGRPTVGAPLSRADLRKKMIARMSYGQIWSLGLGCILLLTRLDRHHDLLSGWNLFMLSVALFDVVAIIVLTIRKWRIESRLQ